MNETACIVLSILFCFIGYAIWRVANCYRIKTLCPDCGGEMDSDNTKYQYTIEWTCKNCGRSYEQLRDTK